MGYCTWGMALQRGGAAIGYGKSMTVTKVTVSLDPAVAHRAKQDVAAGRAKSLSAWLNEAAKSHVEQEDLGAVLADLLDETGGPITQEELAGAEKRLSRARRPRR